MFNLKKQKGFTLTELMVGVTIGMIGSIIIFQALRNSSGIVENVSSGNDANQNGAIAAYMIERDARIAGFGLNQQDLMTCSIAGTRVDPSTGNEMSISGISLNPVIITQGAGGLPDTLVITYASSDNSFIAPAKLTEHYPSDESSIKVSNRYGFRNGGLFLLTDGTTCTLRQIKELPSGGASDQIIHTGGTYKDQYNQDMPIKYNKAGGEGFPVGGYPVNTRIYNIGGTPVSNEYSIQNNNLVVTNGFTGETSILVTDVLDFQAVYGINVGGDINWTTTAPTTAAEFNNLAAIKFAVLARSNTKNVQNNNGVCTTTTTNPSWSGTSNDPENFTMFDNDWRCYRYKVFESTAYLKNMVWRPT